MAAAYALPRAGSGTSAEQLLAPAGKQHCPMLRPASALAACSRKLNQIEQALRLSLACDQGREMTCHKELTKATGIAACFFDPHSPWQKGSCENMNGLRHQYLPGGGDLSGYSQQQPDTIAGRLNNRPRQISGLEYSASGFCRLLADLSAVTSFCRIVHLGVALHIGHRHAPNQKSAFKQAAGPSPDCPDWYQSIF